MCWLRCARRSTLNPEPHLSGAARMAVVVQCFHCNAVLELDEGFRGGVCRCSGCGSLLQVPKADREVGSRRKRPAAPSSASSPGAVEGGGGGLTDSGGGAATPKPMGD